MLFVDMFVCTRLLVRFVWPVRRISFLVLLAHESCGKGLVATKVQAVQHEMLETAQLEEVQQNLENARKIYREIVEQYPDSPEAAKARGRLEALAAE